MDALLAHGNAELRPNLKDMHKVPTLFLCGKCERG